MSSLISTTVTYAPTLFVANYNKQRIFVANCINKSLNTNNYNNDIIKIRPSSSLSPHQLFGTTAVLFFTLTFSGGGVANACLSPLPSISSPIQEDEDEVNPSFQTSKNGDVEFEDKELNSEFEKWKSKTFSLSVPLRIVALTSSIPGSWIKEFTESQGKRLKLRSKFVASIDSIFSDLLTSLSSEKSRKRSKISPSSVAAADIVSIGDSWLSLAIQKGLIEPLSGVEDWDWYKGLSDKWKVYLRRNSEGNIDPSGELWGAPYRWGTVVIAYKKSIFQKNKLMPIEDWKDLWRPELSGRISMIDSPREVVGAVLKYMGASYNTKNIELEVAGGKNAVLQNLALLGKQVRLFDSAHYLKAFSVGDVWVAVGWSSDVIPVAKRMSNVAVVVPKSGASIWADLWAIPAASRLETDQIGGRVRGPSPLIHQWIEFCLQPARSAPFKQEVVPGATPSALSSSPAEVPKELTRGRPRLDTNLIGGVPPPEILSSCEFLEPLSNAQLLDYKWLIASMQQPGPTLIHRVYQFVSSMVKSLKLHSKAT